MQIETSFEETIMLWTAMAASGQTKEAEVRSNTNLSYIINYRNFCPMCEFTQGITKSEVYLGAIRCKPLDCKLCPVNWETDFHYQNINKKFKTCKLYLCHFTHEKISTYIASCELCSSPYSLWFYFMSLVTQDSAYNGYTGDKEAARVQMRYWAEQVVVLVTTQYEKWKEENYGPC